MVSKKDNYLGVSPNDNRYYFISHGTLFNVTDEVETIKANDRIKVCSQLREFVSSNEVCGDDVKKLALMQFIDKLEKDGLKNARH